MIRLFRSADSGAIRKIYAPYILNTAVSFETEVPDEDSFRARCEKIASAYPYLIYEADGVVAGYAYATQHRERAAYRYGVDVSVYLAPEYQHMGIAKQLYDALFALLGRLGYYIAYACITMPNEASKRFHEKCGFELIGTHRNTGYKFGKWRDVIWMEKALRDHAETPGEIMVIGDLREEEIASIVQRCVTPLPPCHCGLDPQSG